MPDVEQVLSGAAQEAMCSFPGCVNYTEEDDCGEHADDPIPAWSAKAKTPPPRRTRDSN